MAIGAFRPNRGKPLEQRIRDIEQHLASLSLDAETLAQILGSGSGFGGGGGGGGIRLPIPESQVKWDPTSGHIHDGTDAEGAKIAHTNLDTANGSALLDGARHSDTGADSVVVGDLVIGDTGPLWRRLAIGTTNWVLKVVGGKPAWGQVAHSELSGTGSALLDGSQHSDTAAGTVAAGDLVMGNATPKWSRLARGTSGYFLKAGASILEWAGVTFLDISGSLTEAQHGNLTSTAGSAADHSGTLSANARVAVKKNGTLVATRRGINLIEGTNVTLTVADDSGNEEVDVTIAQASVSASTVAVQEGDTTIDAAAATLDFATADFNVTSDPAGEANISLVGLTVKEGPVTHNPVRSIDLGTGFDTSLTGDEVAVSLDLSEVLTGDLSMSGNAATVAQIQGADIANPGSSQDLMGLAYQSSDDSFQYRRRDTPLGRYTRASISGIATSDTLTPSVGAGGNNINVTPPPLYAGYLTGIAIRYDGNVSGAGGSHILTVYLNGVATGITLTVTGSVAVGYTSGLTPVAFAAGDRIDLYDRRSGTLNGVGFQCDVLGVWTA